MKKQFAVIFYVLLGAVVLFVLFSDSLKKKNDPNTITVWHWMTDRNDVFGELANRYEQQTGIKIKIDLFAPSDTYSKKITASSQAKILPDIFGVLDTKNTFSDFIKYGYIADLTAEFNMNDAQWKKSIF